MNGYEHKRWDIEQANCCLSGQQIEGVLKIVSKFKTKPL